MKDSRLRRFIHGRPRAVNDDRRFLFGNVPGRLYSWNDGGRFFNYVLWLESKPVLRVYAGLLGVWWFPPRRRP